MQGELCQMFLGTYPAIEHCKFPGKLHPLIFPSHHQNQTTQGNGTEWIIKAALHNNMAAFAYSEVWKNLFRFFSLFFFFIKPILKNYVRSTRCYERVWLSIFVKLFTCCEDSCKKREHFLVVRCQVLYGDIATVRESVSQKLHFNRRDTTVVWTKMCVL